ncbi:MAG: hypothetical protein HPPSJP_1280 [Candidatus Hepatoplasma scabrum]|nr:MAG: hypothetical protein HPPSJP_1280 [Candidatus Hepatoplasma sp.]
MQKEIKIKLIDEKNLKFTLLERGDIGDIINLKTLNNIDLSEIKDKFKIIKEKETKEIIEDKLNQQKKEINLDYQNKIINLEQKYHDQIAKIKTEKREIELNFDAKVIEKVSTIEQNLKEKINLREDQIRSEKNKQIEKLNQEKLEKDRLLNDLSIELNNYSKESEFKLNKALYEKDQEISKMEMKSFDLIKELEIENKQLKEEVDNLKRVKPQNIKLIGNDLENWIDQRLQEEFSWNDKILIKKEPDPINGQKPDFMITIKNGITEAKIVIEAKTELLTSENKKTNRSHLEKLENYRTRSSSDYAILVSELESNHDFIVYKDSKYKNIFIVRPYALVSLLQFMINLLIVNDKILALNLEFEDKQKIMQEWESFLNNIDKTFVNIKSNLEKILKEKNKLLDVAQKIDESANKILNSHLSALENKLKSFSLEKKIVNKIEELDKIENLKNNFKQQKEIQL